MQIRLHTPHYWGHELMVVIYKICDTVLKVMRPILHYIPPIYAPLTLLLTLPEHLGSPSVSSKVRVARSLVFCVVFCKSFFVFLSFFLSHIVLSVLRFPDFDWYLQPFHLFKADKRVNIFQIF